MRVLIADDEPLARLGLRRLLEPLPDVEIAGECASGEEAVAEIARRAPDLVFLDVQMPAGTGFDVIEQVGAELMPPVVFVTAYDQYAVRAFEVHALDYLLKPVDPDRFREAFDRAARALARAPAPRLGRLLGEVVERPGAPPLARFAAREGGRIVLVEARDVAWIEAAGNYAKLHGGGRPHLVRWTMDRLERRLGPAFARIRRSLLVNVRAVAALEPCGRGSWTVVLRDGTRLRSSRRYGGRVRALIPTITS